ncbi:MAG: hypothetical protein GVY21_10135 [Gammaproteobacteria bacterium]|jgi:hypothetical protein|nr:hypothetical protein [Gammaproteobacteria bacterium]
MDSLGWFRLASSNLTVVILTLSLAACSGSSGSSRSGPAPTDPADPNDGSDGGDEPVPSLSFSASRSSVPAGDDVRLSWSASNAQSCDASGGWSGSRAVSGSADVGPIESTTEFRLSCSGPGGGVSRQVTVAVDDGSGPVISLRAEPEQIGEGDNATLTWSVENASSCEASGGWSGSRPVSGDFGTGALSQTTSYSLSCQGSGGSALASVTVEVVDKTIRWQAPAENEDGTPLTDLAGYVVYWGAQSRDYTGSYRIESASVTEWEADIAPGTYYFALTAFDREGNESDYSNELRKYIP